MPLSSLSMRLRGGAKGILKLDAAPCQRSRGRTPLSMPISIRGQNGATRNQVLRAKAPCGAPR